MYTLVYANDVVLVAEEEGEIKSMMERLENYLDKKSVKYKENKNNEISKKKRKRENEKDRMEIKKRKNRGGQEVRVSKIYTLEE